MVILYYHTLAFENRADSVKNTAILSFSIFLVYSEAEMQNGSVPRRRLQRHTPVSLVFFLCYNQIRNDSQQDLQDHKADHNLTVGPFVFQADMVMQRCSCIFEDCDFQETE